MLGLGLGVGRGRKRKVTGEPLEMSDLGVSFSLFLSIQISGIVFFVFGISI